MITLKYKLKNKELTVGSWITIGDPSVAEIMAKSGFDWLVVDMEHSAIDFSQAQQLIRIIELAGCTPLVRVGDNNPYFIKRVIYAGSHGVIVPMVNTAEDAANAVKAVRYPPSGTRGVGLSRAQGYGLDFEDSYVEVQMDTGSGGGGWGAQSIKSYIDTVGIQPEDAGVVLLDEIFPEGEDSTTVLSKVADL